MKSHKTTPGLLVNLKFPPELPAAENLDFDTLYREYRAELCSRLRQGFGAGPPDPEDVTQEAFLRLATLKEPKRILNPRAFLLRTARNIIFDHKRRRSHHLLYAKSTFDTDQGARSDEKTPERYVLGRERLEIVQAVIQRLPYKQRVVLSLSRRHDHTYMQICQKTGWSYGDVSRQMNAALETLAEALTRK